MVNISDIIELTMVAVRNVTEASEKELELASEKLNFHLGFLSIWFLVSFIIMCCICRS